MINFSILTVHKQSSFKDSYTMTEDQLLLKICEPSPTDITPNHIEGRTKKTKSYRTSKRCNQNKTNESTRVFENDVINETTLQSLVKESQNALGKDTSSYPDLVCRAVKNYVFEDHEKVLLKEIQKILKNINPRAEVRKFYSSFHSEIIMHSTLFFKRLRAPMCTLLATKLADYILTLFWPTQKSMSFVLNGSTFTEKEMNGIQFVAGYVVSKLLRKAETSVKSQSVENQAVTSILNASRSLDTSNLTLMDALECNNLCAINLKCLNIFMIAEKNFRRQTRSHNMQYAIKNRYEIDINISMMVSTLTKDVELLSNFNSIVAVSSFIPCDEDKMRLLEKILHLYLRIRTFTLAKDLTKKLRTNMKITKM